jgi:hypothetical protein
VVEYLLAHPDKIEWYAFSRNSNSQAVEYLLAHPEKIDCWAFSGNTNSLAISYLLAPENIHKINWSNLSRNSNSQAVEYLIAHPEKIDLLAFTHNSHPQAIEYLLSHYKIKFGYFSKSPNSFELNKKKMQETKLALHEDLAKYFLHPSKIQAWMESEQDVLEYPYFLP